MRTITRTPRLLLRELIPTDYEDLAEILQDAATMYAYEHAFSHGETRAWLERQFERYRDNGFGLWAVIDRTTGNFLGQCGLTMQQVDDVDELEIGYLFKRRFWHNGYATEAARGCLQYAFETLDRNRVVCTVRPNNTASRRVAERLGMQVEKEFVKVYLGITMPHLLYVITRA